LPAVPVAVTVLPMKLYQKWRPGPTRTDPCSTKVPLPLEYAPQLSFADLCCLWNWR